MPTRRRRSEYVTMTQVAPYLAATLEAIRRAAVKPPPPLDPPPAEETKPPESKDQP